MIQYHQIQQGSDEWLKKRAPRFTGSNAYKLLTTFGAGDHARAGISNFKGNFYTKRGHILEDEAIELYEAINGRKVDRPGFITNDKYPECLYSPDGVDGDILLEVKCFNPEKHMAMFRGDIDMKILAQIHFGELIAEFKKGKLIIYNPDVEAEYAYKEIAIPYSRPIQNNFKRILTGVKV